MAIRAFFKMLDERPAVHGSVHFAENYDNTAPFGVDGRRPANIPRGQPIDLCCVGAISVSSWSVLCNLIILNDFESVERYFGDEFCLLSRKIISVITDHILKFPECLSTRQASSEIC